jgi:hypothetical protein
MEGNGTVEDEVEGGAWKRWDAGPAGCPSQQLGSSSI